MKTQTTDHNELHQLKPRLQVILEGIDEYHFKTQQAFRHLHKNYIKVNTKIGALIKNFDNLTSLVEDTDINLLAECVRVIRGKLVILDRDLSKSSIASGSQITGFYESILNLQYSISSIKKRIRKHIIAEKCEGKNQDDDAPANAKFESFKDFVRSDLYMLVSMLEWTIKILMDLFTVDQNGIDTKGNIRLKIFIRYLDFIITRISGFQNAYKNNFNNVIDKFTASQNIGDEIITALQYQDIFGQKVVHISNSLNRLLEELEEENNTHVWKYALAISEITAIVGKQMGSAAEDFNSSLNMIVEKLALIKENCLEKENDVRSLNKILKSRQELATLTIRDNKRLEEGLGMFNSRQAFSQNLPDLNGKNLQDNIEVMESKIDNLIEDVLVVKCRVNAIVSNALQPQLKDKQSSMQKEIAEVLKMNTEAISIIESITTGQGDYRALIYDSNTLFDDVIGSLAEAKKQYKSAEKINKQVRDIITLLNNISEVEIDNETTVSQKASILNEFKEQYSMLSERINHEEVLLELIGEEPVDMEEAVIEESPGNVEFF